MTMCRYYEGSGCYKGKDCDFFHSRRDLNEAMGKKARDERTRTFRDEKNRETEQSNAEMMQAMLKESARQKKELDMAMKEIKALKHASTRNVSLEKNKEIEVDVKRTVRSWQDKGETEVAEATYDDKKKENKPETAEAKQCAAEQSVGATTDACTIGTSVPACSSKSPEKNDEEKTKSFEENNLPWGVGRKLKFVKEEKAKGEDGGKIRRNARQLSREIAKAGWEEYRELPVEFRKELVGYVFMAANIRTPEVEKDIEKEYPAALRMSRTEITKDRKRVNRSSKYAPRQKGQSNGHGKEHQKTRYDPERASMSESSDNAWHDWQQNDEETKVAFTVKID